MPFLLLGYEMLSICGRTSGLFYMSCGNEISADMAFREANKINVCNAVAIAKARQEEDASLTRTAELLAATAPLTAECPGKEGEESASCPQGMENEVAEGISECIVKLKSNTIDTG